MKKSIISVLLLTAMIISLFPVGVSVGAAEDLFEVIVYAGPSSANVSFFSCDGFDEEENDIPGEQLCVKDEGVNENSYHVYTMRVKRGTYSFRATDAEGRSLGGMTFDIPSAAEVDNIESNSSEIYLRQMNVYTTTKIDGVFADSSEYSACVLDADGKVAAVGEHFMDSSGRTVYPYFVYANGNAELYTVNLIPSSYVSSTCNLGTNSMGNYAISKGTTVLTKSGSLSQLVNAVISAPSGSRVQVFNQIRNFCNEEVPCSRMEETDGTASYTFRLPKSNGNHTYRVSHEGKITKAGYMKLTSDDTARVEVTFAENENPKIRPVYDTSTTIGSRLEDNIMLNINPQNYLRMNEGDSFKARAYRAWQIINTDTANIMIEPDFEYKIISGDSVVLESMGQNAIVRAVKKGISIIEITYDAIEIGGNTKYTGIYGAIDPMRKGLFVVNVGGDTETEIVMPDWDSDFDTVYFTEDSGTYNFTPKSSQPLTVKCNDTAVTENSDGSYTLPISQGNNIVSVSAGNTTEYVVIKGNKVRVNIDNMTNPGDVIKQGDTVNISFDGLHMPMPKFSGIYNPGYGGTVKVSYMKENGRYVQSPGVQYNFINYHTISMTVYEKGTVELINGTIPFTSMGFVPGSHRELTDAGVGANFNAVEVPAEFCHLPDITFDVVKNDDLSFMDTARDTYANLSKVNILCGTSDYQKSFALKLNSVSTASAKNKTATFSSFNTAYPISVTATPSNDNVTMEFRYWEYGDKEKKVVSLEADKTKTLENPFSGEKIICMEIAVTPINPIFGEEKVYSYMVYKSDFAKPVLKTLNIKNGDGKAFEAPYGVLYSDNNTGVAYTQTDYYCYIPDDTESVVVSVARLSGTNNIAVGDETKSIGTSEKAFSAVSVPDNETTVEIILEDGGSYTVKLIKTDGIISQKAVYDNEILAVSFINSNDLNLDFYVAGYNDSGTMSNVSSVNKDIFAGDNTVFMDISAFGDSDNVKLFVWDKEHCPVLDKTNIISE